MRPASAALAGRSEKLVSLGSAHGKATPTRSRWFMTFVRGVDFAVSGPLGGVNQITSMIREWHEVNVLTV